MSFDHRKWVKEYEKIRPIFERFTDKLKILIEDLLKREGIQHLPVETRTKSIQSFEGKIARPDKHYANPLKEITDLSGIRIVTYYLNDVDRTAKLIENEFTIDWANSVNKRDLLKPHEFGYRSVHYVIGLSKARQLLPEWSDFKGLKAEIQIRTVLQHAWAAIDHQLRYKKETDVPTELRRKLFRLSGLLELADEEFSSLTESTISLREEFQDRIKKKDTELEINVETLGLYIAKSEHVAHLIELAKNNRVTILLGTEDLSELVTYCSASGISKINELDAFLASIITSVPSYFKQLFSGFSGFTTNAPYLIIYLLISTHPDIFSIDYMKAKRSSWNPGFLKKIFTVGQKVAQH